MRPPTIRSIAADRQSTALIPDLLPKAVAWLHHPQKISDPLFTTRCTTAMSARRSPPVLRRLSLKSRLEAASQKTVSPPCLWQFNAPKGRKLESIFGRHQSWRERFDAPATSGMKHRPELLTAKLL